MEITVKIEAPELASAIYTLATALESWNYKEVVKNIAAEAPATTAAPAPVAQVMPMPQPAAVEPIAPVMQQPMTQGATALAPAPAIVPTAVQTYSMEQLAVAATQLVDAGRRAELVQLLGAFGVQALTGLPKEQYGAFATQLRAMGAKI